MALTLTSLQFGSSGNLALVTGIIAFDSSYATGGELLAAADIGLSTVAYLVAHPTKGFAFEYDYTNGKLMAYSQGAAHAAQAAVTLDDYAVTAGPGVSSGISISRDTGAGAVTSRWGPLKEIASTDDLSTVTGVRFLAVGW